MINILRDNLYKTFKVAKEKGLPVAFRAIESKVQAKFRHLPRPLIVQECLTYYQQSREIVFPNTTVSDYGSFPKVSIIMLTYNNLLFSQLCLRSIFCNTFYPNFEVIVVDNGSTDDTPRWLKTCAEAYPNIRLILNPDNRGFAAGNNQAVRVASGEYLVFLNNDTIVTHGWVDRLLAHLRNDPKIGLIGPVTNATGNEARIPVTYSSPAEMEAFAADRAIVMAARSFDIRMLAFFCVMTRKDQYESSGGLDERYSIGMFEDDDLAVRYHRAGLKVVCAEDVFIHHFQGAAFGKMDKAGYTRLFDENRRKYEEKWGVQWVPYQTRQHGSTPSSRRNRIARKSMGVLLYRCNICGRRCRTAVVDLQREKPSCSCGSTVRTRSVIHLLSVALFGRSMALPDFPNRPDLHGWGMSDAGYTDLLARKVGYINTFYHQEPRFDITAPLDVKAEQTLDFLISTEVFEHVAPPVSIAFENARRLLKPTGVLVLTVPYTLEPETREHFPDLHRYEIVEPSGGNPVLKNTTRDRRVQVYDNLVFHGGPGSVLEMRVFSRAGLLVELEKAGFGKVEIHSAPCWEFGIYWSDAWSLPIVAYC